MEMHICIYVTPGFVRENYNLNHLRVEIFPIENLSAEGKESKHNSTDKSKSFNSKKFSKKAPRRVCSSRIRDK